ncbi:MAG: multicopper oxidase domain-containing protein [Pseudomonadota bacterium]
MRPLLFLLFSLFAFSAFAEMRSYDLVIDQATVNYSGTPRMAMTVNGGIPGPTIEATLGDTLTVNVHNKLDVETSIHWHGILLPNRQDGVPYLTTPPLKPGKTLTFEFPLVHSGTYWYHSHTGLQEQRGVYGSIVIHDEIDEREADREHVVVLSDWTDEDPNEVMRTLKRGSHYYALKKGAMQSIWGALQRDAIGAMLQQSSDRMPPMDISDVAYDAFLTNGKKADYLAAKPGEIVKLRIINAGASTYFYTEYAAHRQRIVAADGLRVQPVRVARNLMTIAETYDVTVKVPESGMAEFRATAQDGSGHTSLFIGDTKSNEILYAPDVPAPDLYNLHAGHGDMGGHGEMDHSMHGGMDHSMHGATEDRPMTPYDQLQARVDTRMWASQPVRDIEFTLNGDMNRYVWAFNGKTLREVDYIKINRGERIRITLINETMMHHPMHLHGHFFRVINQYGKYSPLKHTVDVPPMGRRVIEFDANAERDWFFHCHVLYHMKGGMSRIFSYNDSEYDADMVKWHDMFKNKKEPWYRWTDTGLMSHMSAGKAVFANTRKTWMAKWELDRENDYEVELSYGHYYDRFLSTEFGVELSDSLDEDQETEVYAAVNYLLPYLFESQLRVNQEGEVRLMLEKELQLTSRLHLELEAEYDTEEEEEWSATLGYTLRKNLDLVVNTHSEFGTGAGFEFRF